jgi:hypothetical protein
VSRALIRPLIERYHYSHSTSGVNGRLNFGLFDRDRLVGAAIVGQPATPNVAAKYSGLDKLKVMELRRFCLVDDAPKNSESYFLSKMVWWMKKNSAVDLLFSFADATYGHIGIIYRAANWKEVGLSSPEKRILWKGKLFHRRACWQHTRPQQKASILAALACGEATLVQTGQKRVYTYRILRHVR